MPKSTAPTIDPTLPDDTARAVSAKILRLNYLKLPSAERHQARARAERAPRGSVMHRYFEAGLYKAEEIGEYARLLAWSEGEWVP